MKNLSLMSVLAAALFLLGGCGSPEQAYRKMLASPVSTAYPELLAHFPAQVPPDARLVRVSHSSGWGTRWAARIEGADAGFSRSLRQSRPESADAAMAERAPAVAEHVWHWLAPALDVKAGSGDYDTVLLKVRDGNHGHHAGLSISRQGRDVLFWAERW